MTDDDITKKKKAMNRLKSRILDEITIAMDNGLSNEEIIGTIETTKHQTSAILLDAIRFKKTEQPTDIKGYA